MPERVATVMNVAKQSTAVFVMYCLIILSSASIGMPPPVTTYAQSQTDTIDPVADGAISEHYSATGSDFSQQISDTVREPSTPDTGTYITVQSNQSGTAFFEMSDLEETPETVEEITVWIYHNDGATGEFYGQLYNADENTSYSEEQKFGHRILEGWDALTFSSLSLNASQMTNLKVRLRNDRLTGGQKETMYVYAMYAKVSYTPAPKIDINITTEGAVDFGYLNTDTVEDTTSSGVDQTQTVRVDGDTSNLHIRSTDFNSVDSTWNLATNNGSEQVIWEFSNDGSEWVIFEEAGTLYSLASNVSSGETRDVYLRITTPESTVSHDPHSADVTIVATSP